MKIKIEMDVPDENVDQESGELTNEAWQEIFDALMGLGDDIDIEEV